MFGKYICYGRPILTWEVHEYQIKCISDMWHAPEVSCLSGRSDKNGVAFYKQSVHNLLLCHSCIVYVYLLNHYIIKRGNKNIVPFS